MVKPERNIRKEVSVENYILDIITSTGNYRCPGFDIREGEKSDIYVEFGKSFAVG